MKSRLKMAGVGVLLAGALVACSSAGTGETTATSGGDSDTTESAEALTEYPVDQVTMIVPYAAGSGPDGSARIIATELEKSLDISIVVENQEGGRALTGLYAIAKSEPDGSVIGWTAAGAVGINAHLVTDTPFTGPDMLTAIAKAKSVPNVLFASPSHGWNTIEDFVAEAKERPGELKVGLPEAGSSQAIQFGILMEEAGIDVQTINYGAGEMILPAVNGTVDASVAQIGPVVQYVEAGQLAWVAALGGQAPEGLDAQPVEDFGYDTTIYQGWEGVVAPAGLPDDVTQMLSDAMKDAVESDAYQEYSATTYSIADYLPSDEFQSLMQESYDNGPSIIEQFDLAAN